LPSESLFEIKTDQSQAGEGVRYEGDKGTGKGVREEDGK
jgi:hypothetical protein